MYFVSDKKNGSPLPARFSMLNGCAFIHLPFFLCCLVSSSCSAPGFRPAATLAIEMVSPGLLTTAGNMVPSTITLAGPAFDVSIGKLRNTYRNFNITHTYLYDEDIVDCVVFQNEVQNILARWYYRERDVNRMTVIVISGKNI